MYEVYTVRVGSIIWQLGPHEQTHKHLMVATFTLAESMGRLCLCVCRPSSWVDGCVDGLSPGLQPYNRLSEIYQLLYLLTDLNFLLFVFLVLMSYNSD